MGEMDIKQRPHWLKLLRVKFGYSQAVLAQKLNCHQSQVSMVESGKRELTKGQEEAVKEFFGWENVQLEKKSWEKEYEEVQK